MLTVSVLAVWMSWFMGLSWWALSKAMDLGRSKSRRGCPLNLCNWGWMASEGRVKNVPLWRGLLPWLQFWHWKTFQNVTCRAKLILFERKIINLKCRNKGIIVRGLSSFFFSLSQQVCQMYIDFFYRTTIGLWHSSIISSRGEWIDFTLRLIFRDG